MTPTRVACAAVAAAAVCVSVPQVSVLHAQGRRGGAAPVAARAGSIEPVKIGGENVVVYLPPSYASDTARRFPAVYLLASHAIEVLKLPDAANTLAAAPGFSEPIVAIAETSADSGSVERFVADDLVAYVDGHYRTLAARISRGLAGESAGASPALRIATNRPDVFSSLYLLSACCLQNEALTSLDGSASALRRYYAIAVTVGTNDAPLALNRQLHSALTRLTIPHYYEEYDGDLAARVRERIETRVLPFFSKNLAAPANPTSPAVP